MKILLEISDSKASYLLEVLKNLSFVKSIKTISDSKTKILNEFKEAVEEMKLINEGKAKGTSFNDFLNEI